MIVDLTDELDQSDSGMESLTASKDDTPERKPEDSLLSPASIETDANASPCLNGPNQPGYGGQDHGEQSSAINNQIIQSLKQYDDEPDETLGERLWGLTEMFPDWMRKGTHVITSNTWSGAKSLYGLSRTVVWIVASSSVILFAPVIFEVERAQVEEIQKSQQKQVLLGTNTMPPMPR